MNTQEEQHESQMTKFFVTTVVNHKCTKRFFLPETDRRQLTVFCCSTNIECLVLPFPALPDNEIRQMPLGAELIDLTTFIQQFGSIFNVLGKVFEDSSAHPALTLQGLGETTLSVLRTDEELTNKLQPVLGEQVVQELRNHYNPEKFDFLVVNNYQANQLIGYIHFLDRFEGSFVPGHYYSSSSTISSQHLIYAADSDDTRGTEKKGAPFNEDQAQSLGQCLAGYPLYQIEDSSLSLISFQSLLNGDYYFQLNKQLFK